MEKNTKIGCGIIAGLGCLFVVVIAVLGMMAAGIVLYSSAAPDHQGKEVIGADGVSQGFVIDPNDTIQSNDYAYQIGAYIRDTGRAPQAPGFSVAIDYSKIAPLARASDTGSLWLGSVLQNNYFIQVGMMTSDQRDSDGSMKWNYFWEMWDDQNRYIAGLMQPMSTFHWNVNSSNTFSMTCTDPTTGEWQFSVNDQVVGKTYTQSCATLMRRTYLFWELTTPTTDKSQLPEFGPFTFHNFQFWDGYNWVGVPQVELSYSYGPVSTTTSFDQASVCPPYGAATSMDRVFQVGSTLSCVSAGTRLWQ